MTRSHGAQIDKSEPMEVQNEVAEQRSHWIPGKRWMIPKSSGRGDPEGRAEDDATESGNGKSKERKAERKTAAKPKEKPDKHKNNIFSEQKGKEKKYLYGNCRNFFKTRSQQMTCALFRRKIASALWKNTCANRFFCKTHFTTWPRLAKGLWHTAPRNPS
jgi:hypothetical protein